MTVTLAETTTDTCPWLHASPGPLDPRTCGEPVTHTVVHRGGDEEDFCAEHAQYTAAWTGGFVERIA